MTEVWRSLWSLRSRYGPTPAWNRPSLHGCNLCLTNSRRYALKQEIKPSDDVEDEETSLTLWHFILEFHSGGSWSLGVQDFKMLYIETIDKTVKLSRTRRRRGIHLTVIPPTKHAWRHIRNNCLSKAFLIGFEMDYPNQTVNLRHIASVDRWKRPKVVPINPHAKSR
mgnify:CR=1 FL=1